METPAEQSSLCRPEGLAGVELLRASFSGQTFAPHFHDGYAVGVIERGALGFRYQRKRCLAPAGSISQVIPGEVHDGHPATAEGWAYRMFYLEPEVVARAASELAGRPVAEPVFIQGVVDDARLAWRLSALHQGLEARALTLLEGQSLLQDVLALWIARHGEKGACRGAYSLADSGAHGPAHMSALGSAWSTARASARASAQGGEDRAVRRTREYLQAHATQPVSLAELATQAGLSSFYLNRVFALQTGLPPHAYQNQLRILKAKKLLAQGLPVAQTAQACGFADQSHLTRRFKRLMGITPGRYRKIVQDR